MLSQRGSSLFRKSRGFVTTTFVWKHIFCTSARGSSVRNPAANYNRALLARHDISVRHNNVSSCLSSCVDCAMSTTNGMNMGDNCDRVLQYRVTVVVRRCRCRLCCSSFVAACRPTARATPVTENHAKSMSAKSRRLNRCSSMRENHILSVKSISACQTRVPHKDRLRVES